MRSLLLLLERRRGPLGASLTALGTSWGALGWVLGTLLGSLLELLGSLLGLLEGFFGISAQKNLYFQKMSFPPRREHDFENLYEQEREASYRGSVFFRLG